MVVRLLAFLLVLSAPGGRIQGADITKGADSTAKADTKAPSKIAVWDTAQPSAEPLASAAVTAKSDWIPIATDKTGVAFNGDAVVSNGRILAVVRQRGSAVEVYSEGPGGPTAQLQLVAASGEPARQLDRVRLVENTRGAAVLEAFYKTAQGTEVGAKFRIKRGEVFVQAEPEDGAGRLRVDCPGRFAILPDIFADDIVLDATKIPLSTVEAPSDNFVLHLTGTGDAIGMCVFESRQNDVKLTAAGEGAKRILTGSEIGFEGKSVWVAVLAGPRIWHQFAVQAGDAGKVMPLDWQMPFPAQWRVDFTRSDALTDSWEMLLQEKKDGQYLKPSWLGGREETLALNRERWNTFLDTFQYPAFSDHEGHGYLQPLKKEPPFRFDGPIVLYPINRVKGTPVDVYTLVDVMRNTLGAGPCEHILDVEGQRTDYKGRPTCGVRGLIEEIYSQGRQKQKRAEVEKHLDDGLSFVTHIRNRITRYIEFGQKMRQYLAEQKKAHPELAETIAQLDRIVERIDTHVAPETAKIQKPAFVVKLNEDFRKNILDYEGPDALEKCKEYGKVLTDIGGNQDELVGESRWVVRTLRQRAAILVTQDPRLAPIVGEIRTRTQEVLRNPAGYEWSRH
jgi:hypothetical protein